MKNHLPIAAEKRKRGRELKSVTVPFHDEIYYTGTEGGKKILVPKSNLEAMKELINLKMRRREDSMFTRTPDLQSGKREFQRYLGKLEALKKKLHEFEESGISGSPTFSLVNDSLLIHIPTRGKSIPKNTKSPEIKSSMSKSIRRDRYSRSFEGHKLTQPHGENKVPCETIENELRLSRVRETVLSGHPRYTAGRRVTSVSVKSAKGRHTSEGVRPSLKVRAKSTLEKMSLSKRLKSSDKVESPLNESVRMTKHSEVEAGEIKSPYKTARTSMASEERTRARSKSTLEKMSLSKRLKSSDKVESPLNESVRMTKHSEVEAGEIKSPYKTARTSKASEERTRVRAKSTLEKMSLSKRLKSSDKVESPLNESVRMTKHSEVEAGEIKFPYKTARTSKASEERTRTSEQKTRTSAINNTHGRDIPFTEERVKFLITGHFRAEKTPIFIIQPYSGKPIFGDKYNLSTDKLQNDVNILINGNYFDTDILIEENDVPKALKIGGSVLPIDNESIIFEKGSTEDLSTPLVDIKVQCMFIKHSSSFHYTPSILIKAEKFQMSKQFKKKNRAKTKSQTRSPVLRKTPSRKDKKKEHVSRFDDYMNKPLVVSHKIESRGNDMFSPRNEGKETIYEYIPDRRSRRKSTATTKSKLYYGDIDGDYNAMNKKRHSTSPHLYKQEEIIYECGKDLEVNNVRKPSHEYKVKKYRNSYQKKQ